MKAHNTKAFIATLCMLCSLMLVEACEPPAYAGNNTDHQKLIRKNVPTISYWQGRSQTQEKDQYGRELFIYTSDGNEALAISQAVDTENQYLWYYEDLCVIMHQGEAGFTDEEVNALKETNDWNKPLDMTRITKRSFTDPSNYNMRTAEEIIKASLSDLLLKDEKMSIYVYAVDHDMQGQRLYCLNVHGAKSYPIEGISKESDLYFFIIKESGDDASLIGYERMEDSYNYTQQLHEFKIKSGWTFQ